MTSPPDFTETIPPGSILHISGEGAGGQKPAYLGPFVVQRFDRPRPASPTPALSRPRTESRAPSEGTASPGQTRRTPTLVELTIEPQRPLSTEALEKLSLSVGPWTASLRAPEAWPAHHADDFALRDRIPVELFLWIDPLVGLSTALAARTWIAALAGAALILLIGVLIPRGFCGYLCPLGTLLDLFDWSVARRFKSLRVADDGWWVHLKYYLLVGVLVAAGGGVLLSGFVSAIPVLTRGLMFLLAPLQLGVMRGWHQVPPISPGHGLSIVLFLAVLAFGFLKPRFWCKYVCPSGAVFSLGNLFRVSERKVEDTCIHCNQCVEICPFDAIKPDFTTRVTDCTLCQTCGGVCPTHAIKFVGRAEQVALKAEGDRPTHEHSVQVDWKPLVQFLGQIARFVPTHFSSWIRTGCGLGQPRRASPRPEGGFQVHWGRRSFLSGGVGLLASLAGGIGASSAIRKTGARLEEASLARPVRPPGSVPEKEFLELCIRCGECFKVCPNNVLQPLGFQQGWEGLWTPQVVADWAGCEPSCNACGLACPTRAIRALPILEKKAARMGLAIVNSNTCLPWAGREACQLCVDECAAAGYEAIEFIRVHSTADASGRPIQETGFLAPQVRADKCVGCGLCQTRCYSINRKTKTLLNESAIVIRAGAGQEDRIHTGSYQELQKQRDRLNSSSSPIPSDPADYLPDFLKAKSAE